MKHLHARNPRVIVLTGPTAVGKTGLALTVAPPLDAEIISADSRQIYRYMDVGTAKPSIAERAQVAHHVLDVVYPDQPFSVVDYQRAAARALDDILGRGRRALVVGGSPHYLYALMDRLEPPPVNTRLRRWLERADRNQPEQLDRWLGALDPVAAASIDARNRRRVIRAVEATLTSGSPFSEMGRRRGSSVAAAWIGLGMEREALHARVRARLRAMLDTGWLHEVRTLLTMGYSRELPSMSATGYSELVSVVRGEISEETAVERIAFATNRYIRHQETWLKRDDRIRWLDAGDADLPERFMALLETLA